MHASSGTAEFVAEPPPLASTLPPGIEPQVDPASLFVSLAELTSDLDSLGAAWLDLESRSDHSFFTSWSWIRTWLACLPPRSRTFLLRASNDGLTVGLGIFVSRRILRRGLVGSRSLFLHQTGLPRYDSLAIEHNGLLLARGYEQPVAERVLDCLLNVAPSWDEVHLNGIDFDAPLLCALRNRQNTCQLVLRKQMPSPYVNLDQLRASQADYLSRLSSNSRQQLRRAVRAYEQIGPLKIEAAETIEQGYEFLAALKGLHQLKWNRRGQTGAFGNDEFETFHRALIRSCLPRGETQLLRVSAGEHVMGYLYNLVHHGRVCFYQSGFDYADPKRKPGLVSHYRAIEHYLAGGAREYDFLASDDQYKKSLSTESRTLVWAVYQRRCWRFAIERRLREWKQQWQDAGGQRGPASGASA